jgi:formylmethanofuran dehydrogenase subunit B
MNALPSTFTALIDARTKAYCPACQSRCDDADMDLTPFRRSHIEAMRDRYGAACCSACTDAHRMSVDGVLLADGEGVQDSDEAWWSSDEALAEAEEAAAEEFADRRMMGGWR